MEKLAIQVCGLTVRYRAKGKSFEAVKDLSFDVVPGEVVGFLGPNGAGKSSTIKSIMGFVSPASGTCRVFGIEAGTIPAKAKIGYLPEVATYYPFLTPSETLRLYGRLQGLRGRSLRSEIDELLELVGLRDAMHKQNRTLSKGMLQRVGIAQSLLGSPELLVLDEVTSGLDPIGRRHLREILKERQRRGSTLFFSSHELAEVDGICDRILLIDKGRLVDARPVQELKQTFGTFSLRYRGAVTVAIPGAERSASGEYWTVSFRDKEQLLAGLELITSHRGEIVDVVAEQGSMEDYFVETIGRAA